MFDTKKVAIGAVAGLTVAGLGIWAINRYFSGKKATAGKVAEKAKAEEAETIEAVSKAYEDHVKTYEVFEQALARAAKIQDNPAFHNGTGYFDGLEETQIINSEGHDYRYGYTFEDKSGRNVLVMVDNDGIVKHVVFERYAGSKILAWHDGLVGFEANRVTYGDWMEILKGVWPWDEVTTAEAAA